MKVLMLFLVISLSCFSVPSFSQQRSVPNFGDAVPVYNAAVEEVRQIQEELKRIESLENDTDKEAYVKEQRQVLLERLSAAGERLEGASAQINAFLTDEVVARTYVKLNIDPYLIAGCYQSALQYVDKQEGEVPRSVRADVAKCKDAVDEAQQAFKEFLEQVTEELAELNIEKDKIEAQLLNPALSEAERKELEDRLAEVNRQIAEKEQEKTVAEQSLDLMDFLELALSLASIALGVATMMAGDVGTGAKLIVGGVVGVMDVLERPSPVNKPNQDKPTAETQQVNDELALVFQDTPVSQEAFDHEVEGEIIPSIHKGTLTLSYGDGRFHVYRSSNGEKILTISDKNIYDPSSLIGFKLSDIAQVVKMRLLGVDDGFEEGDRAYILSLVLSSGKEVQLALELQRLTGDMKVTALSL